MTSRNSVEEQPDIPVRWVAVLGALLYCVGAVCMAVGIVLCYRGIQEGGAVSLIIGLLVASIGRFTGCALLGNHRWVAVLSMPLEVTSVVLLMCKPDLLHVHWISAGLLLGAILIHTAGMLLAKHLHKPKKIEEDKNVYVSTIMAT